jgi:phage tail tape-measure protein
VSELVLHRIEYTGAGTTTSQLWIAGLVSPRGITGVDASWCEHGMMTGTGSSSTQSGLLSSIERSRPVGPIQ